MARVNETPAADPGELTELCRTAEVPADGGLRVVVEGRALAVFRVGDEYLVVDDLCSHGSASLSEGEIDGEEIVCPYHLGRFNLRTGEPTASPCVEPIRNHPATVTGGCVLVRVRGRRQPDATQCAGDAGYDR